MAQRSGCASGEGGLHAIVGDATHHVDLEMETGEGDEVHHEALGGEKLHGRVDAVEVFLLPLIGRASSDVELVLGVTAFKCS